MFREMHRFGFQLKIERIRINDKLIRIGIKKMNYQYDRKNRVENTIW